MDDQTLVAWVLQGEASWLGGQIAVLFSMLCRIAHHVEAGKTFAEALELTLAKYRGHKKPGRHAWMIASYLHKPAVFLGFAKMLGYHFSFKDPMPFAMGGRCDVEGKRREGDAIFWEPEEHIESVHLYREYPMPFELQPEPEPVERSAQGELELRL